MQQSQKKISSRLAGREKEKERKGICESSLNIKNLPVRGTEQGKKLVINLRLHNIIVKKLIFIF